MNNTEIFRDFYQSNIRGTLTEVHTADLHFGAMDPKIQYDILKEQLLNKVANIDFQLFAINGDIFHHKFMSNSDVVLYANLFIDDVVKLCQAKNATLIILHGTMSHDANQLKLFYHYIGTVDIRIVEHIGFEMVKGSKILCIPEEYNMGYDYYAPYLYQSGYYDMACIHGAVKGSIFGCNEANLNSQKAPVFDIDCFTYCRGPVMCGHVHVAGCFQKHIYYCGSPYRWQFGEEQEKGFLILLHNLDTQQYCVEMEEITSFRYDTINLDTMSKDDPKNIIKYLMNLKESGVDYIKVRFSQECNNIGILKNYYKNDPYITIDGQDIEFNETIKKTQTNNEKYKEFDYVLDPNLSEYDIMTRYINHFKGDNYITVDELIKILSD